MARLISQTSSEPAQGPAPGKAHLQPWSSCPCPLKAVLYPRLTSVSHFIPSGNVPSSMKTHFLPGFLFKGSRGSRLHPKPPRKNPGMDLVAFNCHRQATHPPLTQWTNQFLCPGWNVMSWSGYSLQSGVESTTKEKKINIKKSG